MILPPVEIAHKSKGGRCSVPQIVLVMFSFKLYLFHIVQFLFWWLCKYYSRCARIILRMCKCKDVLLMWNNQAILIYNFCYVYFVYFGCYAKYLYCCAISFLRICKIVDVWQWHKYILNLDLFIVKITYNYIHSLFKCVFCWFIKCIMLLTKVKICTLFLGSVKVVSNEIYYRSNMRTAIKEFNNLKFRNEHC